jgi:hypothetical protein
VNFRSAARSTRASLQRCESSPRNVEFHLWRLRALLDERMQDHHRVALHREHRPSDTVTESRSHLPKVRIELPNERHPHRPPELGRLEVRTDRLPVAPVELSKPVTYGFKASCAGLESDTKDGLAAHPVSAPQCTKKDAPDRPSAGPEGRAMLWVPHLDRGGQTPLMGGRLGATYVDRRGQWRLLALQMQPRVPQPGS